MTSTTKWTAANLTPQTGKRIIITGATGGLGYETALALAGAGADVLLTGRNLAKGTAALAAIRAVHPAATIDFARCDVASLASINAFADKIGAEGRPVDILINNAGVMALPRRELTEDGFEMQMGTNVIGHVLLTARLLPLLRAAPAPRTVQLASIAHKQGRIQLDDLNAERSYGPWSQYQQTKLAMLMLGMELQRRSDEGGWGLTSVSAHPGLAATNLFHGGGAATLRQKIQGALAPLICQSAAAGAWPTLMAATAPDVQRGGYYGPTGFMEAWGPAGPATIAAPARDAAMAARLWDALTKMSGAVWPVR